MSLSFDAVIMNPPYSRGLHLNILNNVTKELPDAEIVNLAPIQWLQDPAAEYRGEKSAFNKFENIRNHIEELEEFEARSIGKMFNAGFISDIGIYKLSKNGGWKPKENSIIKKIFVQMKDTVQNHIVVDDLDGISLLVSRIAAGGNLKGGIVELREKGFLGPKEKVYYTNKKNETTSETYEEYRKRVAWGNVGLKSEITNIKFNSKEERDNFFDSYNTKTLRYLFKIMKLTADNNTQFLPWLGDYTRPWTDKDLYEYFNLTSEEIEEIESTVQ